MTATRICLVTEELHPFTQGGIGRLLHNLAQESLERDADLEIHFLLPAEAGLDPQAVRAHFGKRVWAHSFSPSDTPVRRGDLVYPPEWAFTDSSWHAESLTAMLALKQLEEEGISFDVIEFPDYRGLAHATLQEKLLGQGFATTRIAVRLHSSFGVQNHFEPGTPGWEQLGRYELERKALHDADQVIAHLAGIARFNQTFYGFEPTWLDKVVTQFPPVTWGTPPRQAVQTTSPSPMSRDLVFPTKIQPFKRPDLFVRGAAAFMRACPDYQGQALLACHQGESGYRKEIEALVPRDLKKRFAFLQPGPGRDGLLSRSIVVIPSQYESLNLTAYEASGLGATLVLNGKCIAFDDESPFQDGESCFKFDGTASGLAEALRRATRSAPPEPVKWQAAIPHWLERSKPSRPRRAASPLVSVVITNYNLAAYLPEALESLTRSTHPNLEVLVVDDASTDPFDRAVLEQIEAEAGSGRNAIRVIRNVGNLGLAGARNVGVRASQGKYVLPLDADDCISPDFIALGVQALETSPEHDVVVPTAGYFVDEDRLAERDFVDYACHLGDVPTLGLVTNRLSCATALMRRSVLERFPYNEQLSSYEDWELYLRMVHAGHRFLVTNAVHFFYRKRPGSMVTGVDPARHAELLAHLFESLPTPLPPSVRPFALLGSQNAAKPLRYQVVDRVNEGLRRAPGLHTILKRSMQKARRLAPRFVGQGK
jgi:hypothetical protein